MQDYNVLNDRKGIEMPAVYDIATSTDTEHDKHQITAQKFIH